MKELEKIYDPSSVEDKHYKKWVDAGYFHAERDPDKKPYTIVMPPPNITGQLHMGHAMDETWQDILIRYKRMQGYAGSVAAGHGPRVHRHRGEDRGEDEGRGPHEGGPRPRQAFWSALGTGKSSTAAASWSS